MRPTRMETGFLTMKSLSRCSPPSDTTVVAKTQIERCIPISYGQKMFAQSTRVLNLDLFKMLLLKSFSFFCVFSASDPNKPTKAARCRPNSSPAEPYAHF